MNAPWLRLLVLGVSAASLVLTGCGDDGDTGPQGPPGPPGPPGASSVDVTLLPDDQLAQIDVVSEVTSVQIASPPVVRFTLMSTAGQPVIGVDTLWEQDSRFVRFTICKLVPGTNGDPHTWQSYTRDSESGEPDYDTGTSLVHVGDGLYEFTFSTDVANVAGVTYEPGLTHRVAGQLGSGDSALEAQNFVFDFVPSGSAITTRHDVAVMESCNECHSDLVFHGRRFEIGYCVTCHNPDLAQGEGNMSYMIHRIHAGGDFDVLDDGVSFAEVTYPQDLNNCRKCHSGGDPATPQGGNWKLVPNLSACFGCHDPAEHPGGQPPATNASCTECHFPDDGEVAIEHVHLTANPTPNNPLLLPGQRKITYELITASVEGDGTVVIDFRIESDGTPLDVTNLPADLADPGNYPSFLLAWAQPQDGIEEPSDYNNIPNRAGQPTSVNLGGFTPLGGGPGTLGFDPGSGAMRARITDSTLQFPEGATLRAVGLQGYFEQDLDGDMEGDVSLHTPSAVVAVTGDDERRSIVDNTKCASCHEWFEGHGGNRTYNIAICTLCHVPNLSSTGRTVTDPTLRGLDVAIQEALDAGTLDPSVDPNDPLTYPEDAQSLMNLVHGIHAADVRTRPFQHVRGPNRQEYYDWSEITFPRGASTSNCLLCHDEGTYELPTDPNLLPTTVRTTLTESGDDNSVGEAELAFQEVPNETDWINTPKAAACFMCHTDSSAMAHMMQNGALLSEPSVPADGPWSNRFEFGSTFESCTICHGPGKIADLEEVHGF